MWNRIRSFSVLALGHLGRHWKIYTIIALSLIGLMVVKSILSGIAGWFSFIPGVGAEKGKDLLPSIPGGGVLTFLIGAGLLFAWFRVGGPWLLVAAGIAALLCLLPRISGIFSGLGVDIAGMFGFIQVPALILFALTLWWVKNRGGGILKAALLVLLAFAAFDPGGMLYSGWNKINETAKQFGVEGGLSFGLPEAAKNYLAAGKNLADGHSQRTLAKSERTEAGDYAVANKDRVVIIKNDTPIYICQNGVDCFKFDYVLPPAPNGEVKARVGRGEVVFRNGMLKEVFLPGADGDLYSRSIVAYVPADLLEFEVRREELKAQAEAEATAAKARAEAQAKAKAEAEARQRQTQAAATQVQAKAQAQAQAETVVVAKLPPPSPPERIVILNPDMDQDPDPYRARFDIPPVKAGKFFLEGAPKAYVVIDGNRLWKKDQGAAKEVVVAFSGPDSGSSIKFWDPEEPIPKAPIKIRF